MLTAVEKFYIEGHPDADAKDIAKALKTTTRVVLNYRNKLAKVTPTPTLTLILPTKEPEAKPEDFNAKTVPFAEREGAVVMTESRSFVDDQLADIQRKEAYLSRMEKNIHVIDSSKPVR